MGDFDLEVVLLVEPKISGERAERVCRKLGFEEYVRVEAVGFSGGIWVLWHPSKVTFTSIDQATQFLHLEVHGDTSDKFILTVIYGKPSLREREPLE
ncbi:hypothetical protein LINPERHAP2_LOCUS33031 [Linum perenne]